MRGNSNQEFIFNFFYLADGVFGEKCRYNGDCKTLKFSYIESHDLTCGSNNTCECPGDVGPVYSKFNMKIKCVFDYFFSDKINSKYALKLINFCIYFWKYVFIQKFYCWKHFLWLQFIYLYIYNLGYYYFMFCLIFY